ncbi:NADH-quinone oxidoreductase subunit NuoH [Desulfofalx alkaliphila]|uniref:NADH-quinone oxidoreductase subunit NuoH n=1 Tax=Desulfofalx alkaliphila TaxID=105483 RepID=UPI0004E268B8|nr:NADH-quinone oxidoreductase subunit NuoH [Desulfofalx alkaliphila]
MENLFVNIAGSLRIMFEHMGLSPLLSDTALMVVKILAILLFIIINALWLVYMERKVAGYIQCRPGPNRVGPKGLLQTTADIGKLMSKEVVIPKSADKVLFLLAPALIFTPPLLVFMVVPFGENMAAVDLNIGLVYFFALASLSTVIFWMAGWASNNKYSLLGSMRVVAQMVSYELPLIISIFGIVMITGSLNISEIVRSQENMWFIFLQPVAFLIFFIAMVAEANRAPFDLAEGESEIIAGPFTEYGGMAFALFFLAEYTSVLLAAFMTATLFLGGWLAPFGLTFIPGWIWMLIKVYLMIYVIMWLRWTFPRIRVDQLMNFGWKVLLPVSVANVFVTGIGLKVFQMMGW